MDGEAEELTMAHIARTYYESVYRFCVRRVGVEWAADVAQDTFLTAQKALPKYRRESKLQTWLFGIAFNECRRTVRQRRIGAVSLEITEEPSTPTPDSGWIDRQLLQSAIGKLSAEHQEVVLLREIEGLTYDEAAAILGIPSGTVKSRLHHAFLHLRRDLGADSLPEGEVAR